jgi:streptogramin lyase
MDKFIQTVWSIESDTQGQHIVIKPSEIEWAIYELPSTSFSAGSAVIYQHDDMKLNSNLYKDIVLVFGQNVADAMLDSLSKMNPGKPADSF